MISTDSEVNANLVRAAQIEANKPENVAAGITAADILSSTSPAIEDPAEVEDPEDDDFDD